MFDEGDMQATRELLSDDERALTTLSDKGGVAAEISYGKIGPHAHRQFLDELDASGIDYEVQYAEGFGTVRVPESREEEVRGIALRWAELKG